MHVVSPLHRSMKSFVMSYVQCPKCPLDMRSPVTLRLLYLQQYCHVFIKLWKKYSPSDNGSQYSVFTCVKKFSDFFPSETYVSTKMRSWLQDQSPRTREIYLCMYVCMHVFMYVCVYISYDKEIIQLQQLSICFG